MIHGKRLGELMRNELTIFQFNDGAQNRPLKVSTHNNKEIFSYQDTYVAMGGPLHDASPHLKNAKHQGAYETLLSRNWREIHDPFKVEVYAEQPNGASVPERWLYEPGLYALAGKLSTPLAQKFQEWLYGEVLPAIRANGGYSLPQNSALADHSISGFIRNQATLFMAIADELENKPDRKELVELRHDLYRKIESETTRMADDFGQKAATARQYLGMTSIRKPSQENAMMLGQTCKKISAKKGAGPIPRVMEGTFQVAMWPIDILKEAIARLGWQR